MTRDQMNTHPAVETERLILRQFVSDDYENLFALLSDPEVTRYMSPGRPVTSEEMNLIFPSIRRHWERHGFGRWAVVRKDTLEFVGYGGLRLLVDTPEVVYHLARRYWGLGLATEMAKASLAYGFGEHNFDSVVAVAMPENAASFRVMEKAGMRREGEQEYFGFNLMQYRITRSEYRPDASLYALRRD